MNINEIQNRLTTYATQLKGRWKLLLLAALAGALLLAIWAWLTPTVYTATASFHPDERDGFSVGALGDPISMILGGGRAAGGAEAAQMMEVLQSRHLSELVAADTVLFDEQPQLLADLILQHLPTSWSPSQLANWVQSWFRKKKIPTRKQKVIAAGRHLRKNLQVEINDNGFIIMQMPFYDAELLQIICDKYIEKLKVYYRAQQTAKAEANLSFFTHRADSVRNELEKVKNQLAVYLERSNLSVSAQSQLKQQELTLSITWLSEMYKSLILSKEQALAQLQKDTPVIQVLDKPEPPFHTDAPSVVLQAIVGAVLGALLYALYLLRKPLLADIRFIIRESLKEEEEKEVV